MTKEVVTPENDEVINLKAEVENLKAQLKSMEDFTNMVVEQRNEAYNQTAQYKSQLIRQLKEINNAS